MGIMDWAKRTNKELLKLKGHTRDTPTFQPFGGSSLPVRTVDSTPKQRPAIERKPDLYGIPSTLKSSHKVGSYDFTPPIDTPKLATAPSTLRRKPGLQPKTTRPLAIPRENRVLEPETTSPEQQKYIDSTLKFQSDYNKKHGTNFGEQRVDPTMSYLARGRMQDKSVDTDTRPLSERPVFENIRGLEGTYSNQESPLTMYGTKEEAQKQEYSDFTQKKTLADRGFAHEIEKQKLADVGRRDVANIGRASALEQAKLPGTAKATAKPTDPVKTQTQMGEFLFNDDDASAAELMRQVWAKDESQAKRLMSQASAEQQKRILALLKSWEE